MGYASISGRARTNPRSSAAFAVCDRCGRWWNHVNLRFQYDWAGASLINKRILVCGPCYDTPQEQLRAIVLPADPIPILNPRPELYTQLETDYRTTSGQSTVDPNTGITIPGGNTRITIDGDTRTTQPTGEPPGGKNTKPGTDPTIPNAAGGNDPGLPLDYDQVPKTGPLT